LPVRYRYSWLQRAVTGASDACQAQGHRFDPGHRLSGSRAYPGTTEVVQPALEATGFRAGQDFCLTFSPERIDPGNPHFSTRNIPKVVGGMRR